MTHNPALEISAQFVRVAGDRGPLEEAPSLSEEATARKIHRECRRAWKNTEGERKRKRNGRPSDAKVEQMAIEEALDEALRMTRVDAR